MGEILSNEFHFDLAQIEQMLNKFVQIECLDGKLFEGILFTVDLKSNWFDRSFFDLSMKCQLKFIFCFFSNFSFVLIDERTNEIHLIFRNDLTKMKIFINSTSNEEKNRFDEYSSTIDASRVDDRHEQICLYLQSKRIPFEAKRDEQRILIHNGIVQIVFPFQIENIFGTNEIVLRKMQYLLKKILA